MTRIRLALLVVALGLGIPAALLAWRALEGLGLERAPRFEFWFVRTGIAVEGGAEPKIS